jgi:endoglucanase
MDATNATKGWLGALVLILATATAVQAAPAASARPPGHVRSAPALHVAGTHIEDANGTPLQLNGVDRSGTEYACIQGWGIFDGPSDAASVAVMASWHVHIVRVPLNEDCWLNINGVKQQYGGAAYRSAIAGFVSTLEAAGMDVILELHLSAPGSQPATGQEKMPDADHSPDFWTSVASMFGTDPAVVFDLFNEPHDVSWACWRDGCMVDGYQAAGMQSLVDAVRNTGATNVVMLGGLGWSGDLTKWKQYMPNDPLTQLVASWHVYDFGACGTDPTCWKANVQGVGKAAPVLLGEIGESDCLHGFVDTFMKWLDKRSIGYVAWTWDDWPDCNGGPTLITNYDGTPTGYGIGIRKHFVKRFSAP